jgi:hypothetical protein
MALFTYSYSRLRPSQAGFVHKARVSMAPEVHRILGVWPVGTAGPRPRRRAPRPKR